MPTRPAKPALPAVSIHLPVPTSQAAACVWLFARLVALWDLVLPGLMDVPEAPEVDGLNRW